MMMSLFLLSLPNSHVLVCLENTICKPGAPQHLIYNGILSHIFIIIKTLLLLEYGHWSWPYSDFDILINCSVLIQYVTC